MSKPLAWSAVMLTVLAGAAFAQTPPADLDAALKKLTTPAPAAPSKAVELPAQFKTEAPAAKAPATPPAAQPKATTPAAQPNANSPVTAPAAQPKAAAPVVAQPSAPAPATTQTAAAPRPPAGPYDDLPRGAPNDDYQFVSWCEGVLSTHMELYSRVKPELDAISQRWNTVDEDAKNYSAQQIAGRETLALFRRSLAAAEGASTRNLVPERMIATRGGIERWAELGTVDARNQAYSWMNWELPERCVRIAHQLEERSLLMAPLLRSTLATAPTVAPPRPVIPPPAPSATPPAAPTR